MNASTAVQPSLDHVVATLYRSISGPAGEPRDWAAMQSVMLPGAVLTRIEPTPDGGWTGRPLTIAAYRASRDPIFATKGFYEFETRRLMDVRGPLANVFSWFTGRASPGGMDLLRGINSMQCILLDGEWRVSALSWYREYDVAEEHGYVPVETTDGGQQKADDGS
jgi:hypothetical protein